MLVRDHMTLRLASARYAYPAAREQDALDLVGYTPGRFWQRVTWLLEQSEAERVMPREVRRLRRLRDRRVAARVG